MNSHKDIEKKLETLADALGPRDAFVSNVMTRIENSPAQTGNVAEECHPGLRSGASRFGNKTGKPNPVLRRILMNRLTKTAIAAVITITMLTGIYFLTGSIDGATPAFAQVQTAMEKMSWMHVETDGVWKEGAFKEEGWYSFESQIEIHTVPNGDIILYDFEKHKRHYYYSKMNRTIITKLEGEFANDAPGAKSPADFFSEWFKKMEKFSARVNETVQPNEKKTIEASVVSEYGYHDGKKVEVYRLTLPLSHQTIQFKLIADIETHLPIYAKTLYYSPEENVPTCQRESHYNFPQFGPLNLYDAGAPRSVEVIRADQPTVDDFIDCLRLYAEKSQDGRFPDTITILKNIVSYGPAVDDMKENFFEKCTESERQTLKLKGPPCHEFLKKMSFNRDWLYAGKGVSIGQFDTPICWWKEKDIENYTVIFADLSIGTLTKEELLK